MGKTGTFSAMRDRMKDDKLDEEEYDVSVFYYSSGVAQAIATNDHFGHLTLAVIALNAIYMGVDADFNTAVSLNEAEWPFVACEIFFFVFFTFELFIRFAAFQVKKNCLRDAWFRFDAFIVAVIWIDGCILPVIAAVGSVDSSQLDIGPLKLLRLLRLLRLTRLLKAFPELMLMIQGMFVAMRAVSSAMLLLVIAIYGWAIAMHSLMKDEDSQYERWGTISRCMMSLFGEGTLGDN